MSTGGGHGHADEINEGIRQLFDLPTDYILLSQNECVHRRKGKFSNNPGHLFIFNKCVAFHSTTMKAIVIDYSLITGIIKSSKIADRLKGKISI